MGGGEFTASPSSSIFRAQSMTNSKSPLESSVEGVMDCSCAEAVAGNHCAGSQGSFAKLWMGAMESWDCPVQGCKDSEMDSSHYFCQNSSVSLRIFHCFAAFGAEEGSSVYPCTRVELELLQLLGEKAAVPGTAICGHRAGWGGRQRVLLHGTQCPTAPSLVPAMTFSLWAALIRRIVSSHGIPLHCCSGALEVKISRLQNCRMA